MLSKNESNDSQKQPPSFLEKAKAKRGVASEDLFKISMKSGTRSLIHFLA